MKNTTISTSVLKTHPYGTRIPGKKDAAFLAIVVSCPVAEDRGDDTLYPLALMVNRWDGRVGFPGGMVEKNETIKQAMMRELAEETNLEIEERWIAGMVTHETDTHMLHFHVLPIGGIDKDSLKEILAYTAGAECAISEVNCHWAHLANYGDGNGIERLLSSNNLAGAVREELEVVLEIIESAKAKSNKLSNDDVRQHLFKCLLISF